MVQAGGTDSDILRFYEGQNVLITGGTGFLGKVTIEKLLRVCDNVTIYLLVRPKKGQEVDVRFEELFKQALFDVVRQQKPEFKQQVKLIAGECGAPNLGMVQEDIDFVRRNVNVIIHAAATVRFDQSLRTTAHINVRAVDDLIKLAKTMTQLKAFVHVSTAYSHCIRKEIKEEFYPTTISGRGLISLVDCVDEKTLEQMTPILLGEWPNTYVYTKAIAEEVVESTADDLPIVVYRPGIVLPTYKEPKEGWVDNMYGAIGVALGAALGVIRVIRTTPETKGEMVPADYVINGILCSAWAIHEQKKMEKEDLELHNIKAKKNIPIYNYISSKNNPITWGGLCERIKAVGFDYFSMRCVWYYSLLFIANPMWYKFWMFLLHTVPSYLVDWFLVICGRKPLAVKFYKRINKFLNVLAYFSLREWKFSDDNVRKLYSKMNEKDKELFDFDIKHLDWSRFIKNCVIGARIHVLDDPLDTIPAGQRKKYILATCHYTLLAFLSYLLLYGMYVLFSCASKLFLS